MAGRGMGAATKGGGCVSSGGRNKMTSKPSSKVAVMMKDGGMAKKKTKTLACLWRGVLQWRCRLVKPLQAEL